MNSLKGIFLALILAVLLLGLPLCANGEAQKEDAAIPVVTPIIGQSGILPYGDEVLPCGDEHQEADAPVPPTLAYNQTAIQNNTFFAGSECWMIYEEALSYYPSLPLPETFKGCRIEGCRIRIIYDYLTNRNSTPGEICEVEILPENVASIDAIYSDGQAVYSIQFDSIDTVGRSFFLKAVSDEGSLMLDVKDHSILGVYLARGTPTMQIRTSNTVEKSLREIWPGLWVHNFGPEQKITEENAADYVTDPEITALFDALIAFVHDDTDTVPPRDNPCSQCGKGEIKIVSCDEWNAWLFTADHHYRACTIIPELKDYQQSRMRLVTEACTYCIYTGTVTQTEYRYHCTHQ